MATAKKTTAAKSTTRKPAAKAAVKSTAARATVKKPVVRKSVASKSKVTEGYKSFKASNDVPSLMTFKITKQTVYWVIIVAFLIFFQLWIVKLQLEVAHVLDVQQTQIQEDADAL